MAKIIKVKLSELKKDFYVREKLIESHWFLIAELMDAGTPFPPIEITEDFRVQDGRHRIRAAEFLERETIEAVIIPDKGKLASVSHALEANYGGSLPPTGEDIIHTLTYLEVGLKSTAQIKNEMDRRLGKGQSKIPNFKAIFAAKFATFNNSNGHLITQLRTAYKNAEISSETVADTLRALGDLISNTKKVYEDWQARFAKIT